MTLGMVAIVDDEEIVINPVKRLLERLFKRQALNYDVITSKSPRQALELIENRKSDLALVISDVMMESMNGLDFLQQVKTMCPESLMIVLTGYADQETFNALNEQLELFSYQEKPWDNKRFSRSVTNALNLYRRKKILSRYVPEEIVEQVMMHPDNEVLEGTELEATILFLDIRDSTSLLTSEDMGPRKALKHLNMYYEDLYRVISRHDGILDKFISDGFMAVFGVPYPSPSPAEDAKKAVISALQMREVVHDLNRFQLGPPLEIGIGISTGPVIAGNIGSIQRANYTVLGHDVNIAARLEKSIKPVKDGILISQNTYEYVKGVVKTRPFEPVSVKSQMIQAYEVLGI